MPLQAVAVMAVNRHVNNLALRVGGIRFRPVNAGKTFAAPLPQGRALALRRPVSGPFSRREWVLASRLRPIWQWPGDVMCPSGR